MATGAATEHRIDHDGVDLFCSEQGTGPAVLLIHPAAADSSTWGEIPQILAAQCRVITYDRRGYSRSSQAGAVSLVQHAADAASVLERLQTGPATVLGVSAGATIALQLAVTRPDLVGGMALHEPPFHGKRHPNLSTIRTVVRMQRLAKQGHHVEAM